MAALWLAGLLAMLVAPLIFAQGAATLSFVLWGKHRRAMLGLALAGSSASSNKIARSRNISIKTAKSR